MAERQRGRWGARGVWIAGSLLVCAVVTGVVGVIEMSLGDPAERSAPGIAAESTSVSDAEQSIMAWQATVSDYKTKLLAEASHDPNFTGAAFDNQAHSLTVFGVGEPADSVSALTASHPASLDVYWKRVPFSETQLADAMTLIMNRFPEVQSSGIARSFDHVIATISNEDAADMAEVQQGAQALTSVRVEVKVGARGEDL